MTTRDSEIPAAPANTDEWGVDGQQPDMSLADCVTLADVRAAAERFEGRITRTPIITNDDLDARVGASVFLKCENFQRIGAFKLRGAMSAMTRLNGAQRAAGVLTYSSGNHAQAIAMSAAMLGVRAVIVMPHNAPRVKLERTEAFLADAPAGSRIERFDPCEAKREELGRQIMEREGLTLIPPYDHPDVIAGQATAALELIEDIGPLDELYVCVGGGGVLSGSAIVAESLAPDCRVFGVEPELADDAARSFRDGVLRTVHVPPTIADGARTPYTGRHTLPIILAKVHGMLTVSEGEIAGATRWCFERGRFVAEPSGALGLAGLLQRRGQSAVSEPEAGLRIGVIITGGNVDLDFLPQIFALAPVGA